LSRLQWPKPVFDRTTASARGKVTPSRPTDRSTNLSKFRRGDPSTFGLSHDGEFPLMNFPANLLAGWIGFLGGAVTGALMGLFFHREDWLGGYGSFPRRMIRLGHIACFGLGLINILFALTAATLAPSSATKVGSALLIVGMISMPLNCFLTAWRKPFRHLFFIPAGSTLFGIVGLLLSFR
jgi:hypothetical protein